MIRVLASKRLALQVVCQHPLAAQSSQLQYLIAEAVAAHQESLELSPRSQVHCISICKAFFLPCVFHVASSVDGH